MHTHTRKQHHARAAAPHRHVLPQHADGRESALFICAYIQITDICIGHPTLTHAHTYHVHVHMNDRLPSTQPTLTPQHNTQQQSLNGTFQVLSWSSDNSAGNSHWEGGKGGVFVGVMYRTFEKPIQGGALHMCIMDACGLASRSPEAFALSTNIHASELFNRQAGRSRYSSPSPSSTSTASTHASWGRGRAAGPGTCSRRSGIGCAI